MAILFADGFDHYGSGSTGKANMLAGAWSSLGNSVSLSTYQKRTGTYSLFHAGSTVPMGDKARKAFTSNNNEVGVAFGMFLSSVPSFTVMSFVFRYNSTAIATLLLTSAGGLQLVNGAYGGTTIATTDSGIITASAFHHIEMRLLRDNIVGEFEVRLNGITVISVTDINFGNNNPNVFLTALEANSNIPDMYIDDFIIWDTTGGINDDFLGPARVTTIFPTSDGSPSDWLPISGSDGYAMIDEVAPDGDTSFIYSDTLGDVSEFGINTSLPNEIFTVTGIYVPVMAKLSDAGIGNIKTSIVSGGSKIDGPDTPLTPLYTYWGVSFDKDPATDDVWSRDAVLAASIRFEKTL